MISFCPLSTGVTGSDEFRFWTEQYLLHAFLTFNSEFEVLLANSYLNHYHQSSFKAAFPDLSRWIGGSFWMRRKPIAALRPSQTENDTAAPKTLKCTRRLINQFSWWARHDLELAFLRGALATIQTSFQCQNPTGWEISR